MQEHRTWFPLILIGLTIVLFAVIATQYQKDDIGSIEDITESVQIDLPRVTEEGYKSEIVTILNDFSVSHDANSAYELLLNTRVPAEFKDVHLEIVMIMNAFKSGKTTEGESRLDMLRVDETWLP